MNGEMEHLRAWIGRTEEAESRVTAPNADILSATLDRDERWRDGDAIPPSWHWYSFPEAVKLSETGPDGHARRGGFMPPVPLPRRMWAANRQAYHRPLHIGETVRRVSTITDVAPKAGRSGALCFVTVRHEIFGDDRLATTEDHTTVFRGPPDPSSPAPAPQPPPDTAVWGRAIRPTPVLLFRYSAVTMNSHRIHYDRDYATGEEGYPGLLVHGPLIATLLLDLFRREMPKVALKTFSVRSVSPLFDIHEFRIEGAPRTGGRSARLWASNHEGSLAQSAEVTF